MTKQTLLDVWTRAGKGVPGIIAVMHTFGGDLKWNPHVHCIVTCGGLLGKRWKWMLFVMLNGCATKSANEPRASEASEQYFVVVPVRKNPN